MKRYTSVGSVDRVSTLLLHTPLRSAVVLASSSLLLVGSLLPAAEIIFGDSSAGTGWNSSGVAANGASQEVASFTDTVTSPSGAIVFELILNASASIKAAEGDFKVKGGSSNNRLDSGSNWSSSADDESVTLTLEVSGPGAADLGSLEFGGISLLAANRYDEVEFSDGSNIHVENWPATGFLGYVPGSPLETLTPLSLENATSWQLKLTAKDFLYNGTQQKTTEFRIGQVKLVYEALAEAPLRLSDVIGAAHAGAKYYLNDSDPTLTATDSLNEGAEQLDRLGSKVLKVFMGKNYASSTYLWNMNWPATPHTNLTELAEDQHFRDLFSRPDIHTFVIDATGFAWLNWKDGM
ncbi:MAG: hypothetical protein HRT56_08450, partial [Coraliomargarita sp.]|nr:hypothetical protein [Coraliomargarita sp.]